ncbi:Palmitoyltransferase PFA3 [Nakaseomyces bracarensis]|uniref:Palmitoyltransferase n=1 Tax=Nakaseomyces bracarensis TaxID=273131 RepID=A0ABR4NWR6_9SACH
MRYGLALTKLFPKCLTTGIYLWSGYAAISSITIISTRTVAFAVAGITLVALYTYYKIIFVGPGTTIDFPSLKVRDMHAAENGLELPPEFVTKRSFTLKKDGRFRICVVCHSWKPDRCHHCSSCNQCILKMDHHCPWFAECVGYRNQKYFIQFLLYSITYSILILIVTSLELYSWFQEEGFEKELIDFTLLALWLLAVVISISLGIFTIFSIAQLCLNQTTIELYRLRRYKEEIAFLNEFSNEPIKGAVNIFDLGSWKANWKDVMGTNLIEWCLPIRNSRSSSDGNGLFFNVNKNIKNNLAESMDLQDRLLRRVTPRNSLDIERQ